MSISPTDSILIEAAAAGDETAIESLLRLCQTDIRRYARQNCSTVSDAEDAAQETLWLIYRKIGTLRQIAAFSGWLFHRPARMLAAGAKGFRKNRFVGGFRPGNLFCQDIKR